MLHSRRRRRALETLRRPPRPRRILFLCLGNICRSPFAEYAFRRMWEEPAKGSATKDEGVAGEGAGSSGDAGVGGSDPGSSWVTVTSAGFIGPDRASPPEMQEPARERGVDLSDHRSKVVTEEMLADTDLVVVMTPRLHRRFRRGFPQQRVRVVLLGDLDPEGRIPGRAIRDPYGKPPEVFAEVAERIERCVGVLADELR